MPGRQSVTAKTTTVVLGAFTLLCAGALPAFAGVDDYPSPWRPPTAQDSLADSWGELNRECVSFVAWRLHSRNHYDMTWHDYASNWPSHVPANQQDHSPALGAIAWFASPAHVAWVEAINGSNVTIEEYNVPAGSGTYSERTMAASNVSKFLHFKDLPTIPPLVMPTNLQPGGTITSGTVPLSWNYTGDSTGVTFQVTVSGPRNWQSSYQSGKSLTTPTLGPGKYSWTVTAKASDGTTLVSDSAAFFRYTMYDYDGDGHPDLMCYSKTAGHLRFFPVVDKYAISPWKWCLDGMPAVWKLIGTADFNGDGDPDLVWYNVYAGHIRIQFMHGGVADPNSWIACYNSMPLNWQPVGVADFDKDGNPDIVWREVNVGHVRVQLTHGYVADNGWYAVDDNIDPNWQIVGLGDFDSDGYPDLVWYSLIGGHIRIQLVHNKVGDSGNWIACLDAMPLNWQPMGVADFDGDGTPDLVWYDTDSGNIRIKLVHWYVADSGWFETYNGLGLDWRPGGMMYRGTPVDTVQFNQTGAIVPIWQSWATPDYKKASVFLP